MVNCVLTLPVYEPTGMSFSMLYVFNQMVECLRCASSCCGVQRASACGVIRGSRRDHGTPAPVIEYFAPRASSFLRGVQSPVVYAAPAPVVKYAVPAPVVECIAPCPIAPVAEPIAMSFTVPLRHHRLPLQLSWTTCSVSADCSDSATANVQWWCLRRDVVWW